MHLLLLQIHGQSRVAAETGAVSIAVLSLLKASSSLAPQTSGLQTSARPFLVRSVSGAAISEKN